MPNHSSSQGTQSGLADALRALGIKDPLQPGPRSNLYNFLCASNLPPSEQGRRVALIKDLQAKYIDKKVRRAKGRPDEGVVIYITRSEMNHLIYSRSSFPTVSGFAALVKFGTKSRLLPLDLIELV